MALLQQVEAATQTTSSEQIRSPLDQVLHGDAAVLAIFFGLVALAVLGILIAILKAIQLVRLRGELHRFERESFNAVESGELFEVARRDQRSPGARVVLAIAKRGGSHGILEAVAKRAIVSEQQRATSLLAVLASVAAASPFIGLLGTVYGIMKAFVDISRNNSASLKVVAPAIGEALVTTLVGLVAAIPALVAYNLINRWVDGLVSELEAASGAWVTIIADSDRAGGRGGGPTLANPASGSQGPARPSFPTY
ncbi:MAG: MotA/TolQ/ExbB proton channel family protein [Polyangiaceae bacterium]